MFSFLSNSDTSSTDVKCKTQNYVFSGLSEIQSLLNEFSLDFNTILKGSIKSSTTFSQSLVDLLNDSDSKSKYSSKEGFFQTKLQELRQQYDAAEVSNIEKAVRRLYEFAYKVVSVSYGCNHDFADKLSAKFAYDTLLAYYYPGYNNDFATSNKLTEVKAILDEFYKGVNITNTATLDNIWDRTQEKIEHKLEEMGFALPTAKIIIPRKRPDSKEEKGDAKQIDINNIKTYLNRIGVEPSRLVWVIDTFQSWLTNISDNKLSLNGSIASIDGASSSISGNIERECAKVNRLQIGRYIFNNNGVSIDIYVVPNTSSGTLDISTIDLNKFEKVATCKYGASVTTIINTIQQTLGRDLTGASRSEIAEPYKIEWLKEDAFPSLNDKILLLEFIKAAGDQAPIDICKNCITQSDTCISSSECVDDSETEKLIFCNSTGDILASKMAESVGNSVFLVTSTKIGISIPYCAISVELAKSLLIDFIIKCEQMRVFLQAFENDGIFYKVDTYLNQLSTFSAAGQITAIYFYKEINQYFEKSLKSMITMKEALVKLQAAETDEEYIDFYSYLKNNLVSVNFVPDKLYDFLFATNDTPYDGFRYNTDLNIIQMIEFIPQNPDDTAQTQRVYCDEEEYLKRNSTNNLNGGKGGAKRRNMDDHETEGKKTKIVAPTCVNDPSTYIQKPINEYVEEKCNSKYQINTRRDMDQCILEIDKSNIIKRIPVQIPKNYIDPRSVEYEGFLNEGYLLVGEVWEQTKNGYVHHPHAIVPLQVLRATIQSTIVDLLWTIPYEAFEINYTASNLINATPYDMKLKYILKTIQFGLNDLYIDMQDVDVLVKLIKYVLLGFAVCPFDGMVEPSSEPLKQGRTQRSKPGIIPIASEDLTEDVAKQKKSNILLFFAIFFMRYNVDEVIKAVLNTNSDNDFLKLRVSTSHLQPLNNNEFKFASENMVAQYTLFQQEYNVVLTTEKQVFERKTQEFVEKKNESLYNDSTATLEKLFSFRNHNSMEYSDSTEKYDETVSMNESSTMNEDSENYRNLKRSRRDDNDFNETNFIQSRDSESEYDYLKRPREDIPTGDTPLKRKPRIYPFVEGGSNHTKKQTKNARYLRKQKHTKTKHKKQRLTKHKRRIVNKTVKKH